MTNLKEISEFGFELVDLPNNTILIGRELVGVNSETIVNYCPNSKQIFTGYFEANDDQLYLDKEHKYPREIIASQTYIKGIPRLVLYDPLVDVLSDKNPYTDEFYQKIHKAGFKEGYNQHSKTHPLSMDQIQELFSNFFAELGSIDGCLDVSSPASCLSWFFGQIETMTKKKALIEFEWKKDFTKGIGGAGTIDIPVPKIKEETIRLTLR
jgi:hypothetical protein